MRQIYLFPLFAHSPIRRIVCVSFHIPSHRMANRSSGYGNAFYAQHKCPNDATTPTDSSQDIVKLVKFAPQHSLDCIGICSFWMRSEAIAAAPRRLGNIRTISNCPLATTKNGLLQ